MRTNVLRRVEAHDRYQLELKLGYPLNPDAKTHYRIDTYFFAPQSLGIHAGTYDRSDFYRDIQQYVRVKTPKFLLNQILDDGTSPLCQSERLLEHTSAPLGTPAEQQLDKAFRILRAVIKSAGQNHLAQLDHPPAGTAPERNRIFGDIIESYITAVTAIQNRYHVLEPCLHDIHAGDSLYRSYLITDESISILVEDSLLRSYQLADQWLDLPARREWRANLANRVRSETQYRAARGYPSVLTEQTTEQYMLRLSALKKYTSSVLWLPTSTRREGTTIENVLFAIAAGVSMIFATLLAFYAQAVFGQLTFPVFVALVVGYMFKDRIKEGGKAASARLLSRHNLDYRTTIFAHDGKRKLGYVREKVTHIAPEAVPAAIYETRTAGPPEASEFTGATESTILYTKLVELGQDAAQRLAEDGLKVTAINDIMRLDVRPFLRKMDDPYEVRLMLKDAIVVPVRCHRTYRVNLVSLFTAGDGTTASERTLMILDRQGIQSIHQYDAQGRPAENVHHRWQDSDDVDAEFASDHVNLMEPESAL